MFEIFESIKMCLPEDTEEMALTSTGKRKEYQ